MVKHFPYDRAERIAEAIHHIISLACVTKLSDPRLKGVEVRKVIITKDLQTARVYFYFHEADETRIIHAKKGFESAAGYLKRLIGDELKLRYTPQMQFYFDETVALEEKINEISGKKESTDEKI